ncbi:MAG TPA: hypothetical protein VKD91_15875 [Pyrinomonadaceae bacterium]|nr:hypothetical protein [Pyrinomonadaceae bacterium]
MFGDAKEINEEKEAGMARKAKRGFCLSCHFCYCCLPLSTNPLKSAPQKNCGEQAQSLFLPVTDKLLLFETIFPTLLSLQVISYQPDPIKRPKMAIIRDFAAQS